MLVNVLHNEQTRRQHTYGRAGDDGLGGAQVLAETPGALNGIHELPARRSAAADLERQHAAVHPVLVLLVGQRLLRERLEARVPEVCPHGKLHPAACNCEV